MNEEYFPPKDLKDLPSFSEMKDWAQPIVSEPLSPTDLRRAFQTYENRIQQLVSENNKAWAFVYFQMMILFLCILFRIF